MNTTAAIKAYKDVDLETSVMSADSHQLVSLLFRGALAAIAAAKYAMEQQDIPAKGKSTSKAISIIGEGLQASLNLEVGGELAQNLFSLYGYMVKRLVEANANNDTAILDEVTKLLTELQGAWDSIRAEVTTGKAAQQAKSSGTTRAHAHA
jgi:flagellar protein FliS